MPGPPCTPGPRWRGRRAGPWECSAWTRAPAPPRPRPNLSHPRGDSRTGPGPAETWCEAGVWSCADGGLTERCGWPWTGQSCTQGSPRSLRPRGRGSRTLFSLLVWMCHWSALHTSHLTWQCPRPASPQSPLSELSGDAGREVRVEEGGLTLHPVSAVHLGLGWIFSVRYKRREKWICR